MTDIVLRDVDEVLFDRIGRVARRSGWDLSTTLMHLLEQGLHASEAGAAARLDGSESDVLQSALDALRDVPDDPGFALIGRVAEPGRSGNSG